MVSKNGVGAVSPVRWVRVIVDGGAPDCEMSFDPPLVEHPAGAFWARRGTVVKLQARDAPAGVASVELTRAHMAASTGVAKARLTLENEGVVTVGGRCLDRVGNLAEVGTVKLCVDGTPPEGELSLDGTWVRAGGRIVAAPGIAVHTAWNDVLSGVAASWIAGDGRWKEGTSLPGGWAEGDHVAEAKAKDRAGNESAVLSLEFTVDGTPPDLQCRVNVPGAAEAGDVTWVSRGTVASCHARDAVAGVESVEWSSDGASWKPAASGVPLSPGGVRVRARDAVGNVREVVPPFRVDAVGPQVAVLLPGGRAIPGTGEIIIQRGRALVIVSSDQGSGVETVEYRVGRGPWSALHGPVTFRDAGSFVLGIRAVDRAGNVSLGHWRIRVIPGAREGAFR